MADVKICGIRTPADFDTCRDAGAAFIGMVFYPKSPRHLDDLTAQTLADHADRYGDDAPLRVALTVNMDDMQMDRVVAVARPHLIQLHGDETPERAKAIIARYRLPIIKAIRVATAADLDCCADWNGIAEWLLFDAKGDPGGLPGGTGHSFDWRLLDGQAGSQKWMLAGGLDVDNVARAIATTGAKVIDISSGVESAPGQKDPERIRAFVSAAQIG